MVGLGTIIIGCGIIVFSIFTAIALYTYKDIFTLIGSAMMILCIIIGAIISFKAMIKYNKGIF
jgi:hypothetical protein